MGTVATPRLASPALNPYVASPPPVAEADAQPVVWPIWQRVLFRFFFIYLVLQVEPWDWFRAIPGAPWLLRPYGRLVDWAVHAGNARFFHVRDMLVMVNGSGDTSCAWAQGCSSATPRRTSSSPA